jgi:ATP-dependent Lon protease
VWPIAGLKEKLLAALRGGTRDLVEIADSITETIAVAMATSAH